MPTVFPLLWHRMYVFVFSPAVVIWVRVQGLCEWLITWYFWRWGVVSISPSPQAVRPPLVGSPRLLIEYIRSYPLFWRPFLHPQPEDALVISVMQGISWLAENRLACQEELCSMETVNSDFSKRHTSASLGSCYFSFVCCHGFNKAKWTTKGNLCLPRYCYCTKMSP